MAKEKEKKNYTTIVKDGRMTLQLNEKDADGRVRSASCEYPFVCQVVDADGNVVVKKQTKKQTEKFLLELLGCKA